MANTITPSVANAKGPRFAGVAFDDPDDITAHDNLVVSAEFFLGPVQDEILALVRGEIASLQIYNDTGGTLTRGTTVYITGWDTTNDAWNVAKADADEGGKLAQAMIAQDVADSAAGTVVTRGRVLGTTAENVDTSGFSKGDAVYQSNTAGAFATSAGTIEQVIGHVVTASATVGEIAVVLGGHQKLQEVESSLCEGRLTLETGVAVSTSDQTAKTSVYFTPYKGNRVSLYDTTLKVWRSYKFAELTLALGTLTDATNYDVFLYVTSNVLTLEAVAWTNDTTRATAITLQDGVYCKSGSLDRKYIGTFRTTSTTTTEDSTSKRFLWNYYNRTKRSLFCSDSTDSWTYTTATWRAANANTTDGTGRFSCVVGVAEDSIRVQVNSPCHNTGSATAVSPGVGVDSTSVNSSQSYGVLTPASYTLSRADYVGMLSAGYHFIQRLEISQASGTTTWYGDNSGTLIIGGMVGEIIG